MAYSTFLSLYFGLFLLWEICVSIYQIYARSKNLPELKLASFSSVTEEQLLALKEVNISVAAKYNRSVVKILWVSSNSVMATAVSFFNTKFIILSEGVFLKLSPEAIKATFAHELGHIYRRDSEKIYLSHVLLKVFNSAVTVLAIFLLENSVMMENVLRDSPFLGLSGMILLSITLFNILKHTQSPILSSYHFSAEFAADNFSMENVSAEAMRETLLCLKEQSFNSFAFMRKSNGTHPPHDERILKTHEFEKSQKSYTSALFKS